MYLDPSNPKWQSKMCTVVKTFPLCQARANKKKCSITTRKQKKYWAKCHVAELLHIWKWLIKYFNMWRGMIEYIMLFETIYLNKRFFPRLSIVIVIRSWIHFFTAGKFRPHGSLLIHLIQCSSQPDLNELVDCFPPTTVQETALVWETD